MERTERCDAYVREGQPWRCDLSPGHEGDCVSHNNYIGHGKLDKKFYGDIYKAKDGTRVPDDEYIVFLAHDNAFASIVHRYAQACEDLGCDEDQIRGARELVIRIARWRAEHVDKCRLPDAKGESLLNNDGTKQGETAGAGGTLWELPPWDAPRAIKDAYWQVQRLPDYEVVWLWQLVQGELERRDASWPRGRGWRAFTSTNVKGEMKENA